MSRHDGSQTRGRPRADDGLALIRKGLADGTSPPVARLIGFELTSVGRGRSVMEMDAGPQHANPMGTLHGGVICDIADAAMGIAYMSTLAAGESFTTMEMKVNFLRPVWTGHLTARGRVIKKGRTTGLVECRVADEKDRLIAFATCTCMTLSGSAGDISRGESVAKDG